MCETQQGFASGCGNLCSLQISIGRVIFHRPFAHAKNKPLRVSDTPMPDVNVLGCRTENTVVGRRSLRRRPCSLSKRSTRPPKAQPTRMLNRRKKIRPLSCGCPNPARISGAFSTPFGFPFQRSCSQETLASFSGLKPAPILPLPHGIVTPKGGKIRQSSQKICDSS
jgi:hypothetical protein